MEYLPVLIMAAIGAAVGIGGITVSAFIGPKFRNKVKDTAFECGVPAFGNARQRVSVRFYLVAILFLLFDVEAIFFFPWAVVYKDFLTVNAFILIEMALFMLILMIGYFYVLGKGALRWE